MTPAALGGELLAYSLLQVKADDTWVYAFIYYSSDGRTWLFIEYIHGQTCRVL